jgi:hypothetical protein
LTSPFPSNTCESFCFCCIPRCHSPTVDCRKWRHEY